MLLKGILMIVGLLLVWTAFRLPKQAMAPDLGMIQVEGKVIGQRQVTGLLGPYPVDVFAFTTRDGQSITASLSERSEYRVGDRLVVCYDPVTPEHGWGIAKMTVAWTTYAVAALGLVLLVAGCIVKVQGGR